MSHGGRKTISPAMCVNEKKVVVHGRGADEVKSETRAKLCPTDPLLLSTFRPLSPPTNNNNNNGMKHFITVE